MSKILRIKNEHGDWVNVPAIKGDSAYEVAVRNGFEGTEEEWVKSLKLSKVSELENDAGYVKGKNDADVEILTAVNNQWSAYFKLVRNSLKVKVFGFGGVEISSFSEKGVKVTKLADPENPDDAVHKQYVDELGNSLNERLTQHNTIITGHAQSKANKSDIPTKVSQLANDANYATKGEVPTKVSQLENDAGYVKSTNDSAVSIVANEETATLKALSGNNSTYFEANGKTADATIRAYHNLNLTASEKVNIVGSGGVNIHNVSAPTENGDAANKKYVDDAIADNIPDIPKNVSAFTNDANYLTSSTLFGGDIGLTAVGSFNILAQHGTVNIKNVATPTNNTDAANKKYVDESKSYITLRSPQSKVIKLSDTAEAPLIDIDAPDGSTVSVYGKNLMPCVIVNSEKSTETNLMTGFLSKSLPAGTYTIQITHDEKIAQYVKATARYDSGNSFSGSVDLTFDKVVTNIATLTLKESGKIWVYAYGDPGFSSVQIEYIKTIQVEAGSEATEYEKYKEPQTVTAPIAVMPTAYYPNTTVICDNPCTVTYTADSINAYNNLKGKINTLEERMAALEVAAVNDI